MAGAFGVQAQTLKLGHITPPTDVWHQVSEQIGAGLEKASGGKMKVAVSPLQKLGNEAQMINLMQAGAQQFGVFTVGGLSNREESFLAWSLPYTFKDVAHATRAASTPAAKTMLKRPEPHGLVGLGYTFAGMRHVLSLQPVASVKDLANKKIRSFPCPIYNDWWQANGAAPTAMPLSEVAPSLTTKLLDAVDVDLDAIMMAQVVLRYFFRAPIFWAEEISVLVGAITFMASSDLAVLFDSIPIQFFGALEINGLLAIPLFMLVGEIMNKAGLTQRLIAVAEVLLGGLPAGERNAQRTRTDVLIAGLVPTIIPVVVIAGIMMGIMTPTESGAVAAIIVLVLGFAYRDLKVRDLGGIFLGVALNTATITGLIAAASLLSWVLAFQGVPKMVVEQMAGLTDSPFVFLLLVIGMLLILGMFLESISVLIVVVPILMPVVNALGIDPIHFGVICTIATVIGLVTPPVGPGLYIAMVQADIGMGPLFRATIPFLLMVMAILVLIAAVPALSTWLPALMR